MVIIPKEKNHKSKPAHIFKSRVVIREGPGRTPGFGPSTGSGQRGVVPPRVRVGISRGRPVGPVYSGNDVILKFIKTILVDYSAKFNPIWLILISFCWP